MRGNLFFVVFRGLVVGAGLTDAASRVGCGARYSGFERCFGSKTFAAALRHSRTAKQLVELPALRPECIQSQ